MMRKITRLLAAALAVTTLAAASPPKSPELPKTAPAASGPVVSPAPTAPGAVAVGVHSLDANDLKAWLDGLLPYAMKTGDIAGGVIAIVKDGKVLFEQGYGYADVD